MLTKIPSDPSLADLLNLMKKDIFLSLNCHAIGKVEIFNPANQTVQATMAYKKTFVKIENGSESEVLVDYPILLDCPAVVIGGGPFSIKMPITKGDECLILFNDRSIDKWFQSGQVTSLDSSRMHSFSDAFVLVGLHSTANPLVGYDPSMAIMGDGVHDVKLGSGEASLNVGTTVVKAGLAKVTLENQIESLNAILQDLVTQIKLITVSGVTPGSGSSAVPVNSPAFTLIATRLGALLE